MRCGGNLPTNTCEKNICACVCIVSILYNYMCIGSNESNSKYKNQFIYFINIHLLCLQFTNAGFKWNFFVSKCVACELIKKFRSFKQWTHWLNDVWTAAKHLETSSISMQFYFIVFGLFFGFIFEKREILQIKTAKFKRFFIINEILKSLNVY